MSPTAFGRERPVITIRHQIPGRVRLGLSHPTKSVKRLETAIKHHAGIEFVRYTPVTRSVLVRFDPGQVSHEEIAIRTGLSIAIDYGAVPVRILDKPDAHDMSNWAVYSGVGLLAALGLRVTGVGGQNTALLDWLAGLTTAGAVMEHGWDEVRRRGNFDPEVLSIVYLLTSFVQGNTLPAAFVTWASTFGRHLAGTPATGVELRPMPFSGKDGDEPHFEVVVSSDPARSGSMNLLGLVPKAVMGAFGGGDRRSFIDQVRDVSRLHGEMLEGLGEYRYGIPLRVR